MTTDVGIVHRDDALLVLAKPSGLPTTSPDPREDCLVRRAAKLDPDAPRLHPTSRLDAEVSGLVTFARTKEANQAILAARREGRYGRLYLAIATTAPTPPGGRWSWAIGIDPRDPRRRRAHPAGAASSNAPSFEGGGVDRAAHAASLREATTDYAVIAETAEATLLALRPRTGRTHQLRVHAAEAGSPLVGDVHYGGVRRVTRANGRVVRAPRVMLHCASVDVPDVAAAGTLRLRLPVLDDFAQVWARLGGDAASLTPLDP